MYHPEMEGNPAHRISDQAVENLKAVEPWVQSLKKWSQQNIFKHESCFHLSITSESFLPSAIV